MTNAHLQTARLGLILCLMSGFAINAFAQNNKNTSNIYTPQNNQTNNASGFGGFYTQIGLGYQNFTPSLATSNYTVSGTRYGANNQISSSQSMTGTITAGYDFTVNPGFLLGLGAELSPFAGKSSAISGATAGTTAIPATSYKLNNTYNLFLSPSFPVDKLTAIYAKVGYSRANVSSGPNLDSLSYSGYSVGLGYKTIVSGSLYAYVEGNYYNYGKVNDAGTAIVPGSSTSYGYSNSFTANSYNLLYGLGVRF